MAAIAQAQRVISIQRQASHQTPVKNGGTQLSRLNTVSNKARAIVTNSTIARICNIKQAILNIRPAKLTTARSFEE